MPETFGDPTTNRIWEKSQAHKITYEFTVKTGSTVKKGQPVKLHTDGTITPLVAGDSQSLIIGTALHDAVAGARSTVVLRANAIVVAIADGDTLAAPVTYTGQDSTTNKPKYSDAGVTADTTHGWSLESVLTGQEMLVAIL